MVSTVGFSQSKHDTIRIGDEINYDLIYDLTIEHLNDIRKSNGLGAVVKNDSLMGYADFHTKDMFEKKSVFHNNR